MLARNNTRATERRRPQQHAAGATSTAALALLPFLAAQTARSRGRPERRRGYKPGRADRVDDGLIRRPREPVLPGGSAPPARANLERRVQRGFVRTELRLGCLAKLRARVGRHVVRRAAERREADDNLAHARVLPLRAGRCIAALEEVRSLEELVPLHAEGRGGREEAADVLALAERAGVCRRGRCAL